MVYTNPPRSAQIAGRACVSIKDTLCPDLCQSFYLTRAARERLGHHEEQVGVLYPFSVEQPVARQWWIVSPLRTPWSAGTGASLNSADAQGKPTVSSFHSPAARCRSWWCLWSRTDFGWWHSCFPSSQNLPREDHLEQKRLHVVTVVLISSNNQEESIF